MCRMVRKGRYNNHCNTRAEPVAWIQCGVPRPFYWCACSASRCSALPVDAAANLPVCCRRTGSHHCGVSAEDSARGSLSIPGAAALRFCRGQGSNWPVRGSGQRRRNACNRSGRRRGRRGKDWYSIQALERHMNAEAAQIVSSLEAIRRLPPDVVALKGDGLGDPEVIAIASLDSLRELDLSGCEEVTDASVTELRRLSSLHKLDLSFCNQITDASGPKTRRPVRTKTFPTRSRRRMVAQTT
jgi:hypothetical protein